MDTINCVNSDGTRFIAITVIPHTMLFYHGCRICAGRRGRHVPTDDTSRRRSLPLKLYHASTMVKPVVLRGCELRSWILFVLSLRY